jgi:hypothetical protein
VINGQLYWTRMEPGWYRSEGRTGTYEVTRSMDHPELWITSYRPPGGMFEPLPDGDNFTRAADAKAYADEHNKEQS